METGQSELVTKEYVEKALAGMRPSVTKKELMRYEEFKSTGE